MAGQSLIGNLAVNLTLATAAFHKGATYAEKRAQAMKTKISGVASSLTGLGTALAGSLAVGAVTSAISRGLAYASSLGEVAQQLGVTTKTLQEFRYAASQAGISQEEMDKSLAKLTRSLGELQQGSKSQIDAFAQLGLSAQQLRGVEAGEAMRLIADGLAKIPDPAKRAAIEVDIFGRAGQKLDTLLAGGRGQIDGLSAAAQKLGIVLSDEQIQNADKTADKLSAVKQVIEAKIAANVANNSTAILSLAEALGTLGTGALTAAGKIVQAGQTTRAALDALDAHTTAIAERINAAVNGMAARVVASISSMVTSVRVWVVDRLGAIWDTVQAKVRAVADAFKWMGDAVVHHSYVPDMVDAIGKHIARLDGEMVDPALSATDRVSGAFSNLAQSVIGSIGGIARSIKSGDWLSALEGIANIATQLFAATSGGGGSVFGSYPSGGALGMARGGSGIFGGRGGVDRNVLSLNGSPIAKVSRGERFAVSPHRNDNAREPVVVHVMAGEMFDARVVQGAATVVRAASPGIIDASRAATINTIRRPRL